jgi:hypothetical protein
MLPALQQLAIIYMHPHPSFVGLTSLRALLLGHSAHGMEAAERDALEALPRLAELEVSLDPGDPVQLSGLVRLTNLRVLQANIVAFDNLIDMGAFLGAVAGLPLLHTAGIRVEHIDDEDCMLEWGWGGLRRFALSAPALRYLSIHMGGFGCVPASVVGALAMHTGLRRLLVDCSHEESSAVEALAAEVSAACGSLTIELHSVCSVQVCAWRNDVNLRGGL